MAAGHGASPAPFEQRILRWKDFGGAVTRTGELITKPIELEQAEMILAICDRFKCTPSQARLEDVECLELMAIEALAHGEGPVEE